MIVPALFNTIILLALSVLHFYWAFGGRQGLDEALPEKDGVKVLNPHAVDCLIVGMGLVGFALLHLYAIGWQVVALPDWLARYGLWIVGGIFLLRAVGDFRYVGFFKRIRDSRFAELDTWAYSPLCLLLMVNSGWLSVSRV